MNYVDEEMDFPWPTEPPRDSDESREKDMGSPFEYQLHLTATQQQQPAVRTKKSMFKKLTGMFRSNNTSPTTPPIPLPSDEASAPSADLNGTNNDPYANILSSAAGIPDPLLPPPPSSPFMEPRKSSSSSRSLFLNGLFTRSQETLTPPPSKKERNVLRKKGSASSLRAMRNGNGNGSTTSLAKSVKEVTKKKSGLAMEIKVPPPPQLSQQRPPDLVLSPTTPDYRDEDTSTASTPTPSSLPPTPTSPSSLSKSPSIRRPPRPLASLPPAPPSPTFPPPPPPPFQHSELPPRRDSLLFPPSPSSPYLSSFPQPPPSPPSVRVQHPSPEKPPSLTSSSSSSGGAATTAITTPSDSIDNGRGPPHHHIKSTVLPRLKDPFKQIRYRDDILSSEDPELLLSDMEVGLSRNWTTFANESTERFRAAVVEEDEDGEDVISMITNEGGKGKGKKGHKIGKLSNKPTSEKPKPSLFRKRHPPSPLTLSPSLSTYSSSSALPSPLLLTPPAPHSPIRPLVQALEDIDIEDVENDTVPKGNYHYAKTTDQQLLQQRGGGRVVVARRFDL